MRGGRERGVYSLHVPAVGGSERESDLSQHSLQFGEHRELGFELGLWCPDWWFFGVPQPCALTMTCEPGEEPGRLC